MSDQPDPRLQRLLGGEHLAALRKRLRRRFERAGLGEVIEQIRVAGLNMDEHAALAALVGRPQRNAASLRVDIRAVDAALHDAGIAPSLRDALEKLDGPIAQLAELRLRQQTSWSAVIEGCHHPGLVRLLLKPDGAGLLKRLSRQNAAAAAVLCRRAEAVLTRLPARGIARSHLAATVLGDAHALDDGRGTARLVLAVWRDAALPEPDEANVGAERTRDIWARAGVLVNELARPALFLNVPAETGRDRWPPGEPVYASLRSLLRSPPDWQVAGRNVYVCENPNLLAIAADQWGEGCAPLACTDGMPAAAQRCLLSQLAQAGARLLYHGDFDWPGVQIGNHVMREHGAKPWRFGAIDYLAAAQAAPDAVHFLEGKAVDASWDEALMPVMRKQRIAIAEEALAATLLPDLDGR